MEIKGNGFKKEEEVFNKYLAKKMLKRTIPRTTILKLFLATEAHVTVEEFYDIVKKYDSLIGFSTVYRTLKLLCECNLARELHLGDRIIRYEHDYDHDHHDHFVCNICDTSIEFLSEELEELQHKISKKYSFTPQSHRLIINGICKKCRKDLAKNKDDSVSRKK